MATSRKLTYPHPAGKGVYPLNYTAAQGWGLHQTAGLAHNWSIDFMAPGKTEIYAVERGTIWKMSGHDPADYKPGSSIFGWSVYLMTPDGMMYFYTHMSIRYVRLGQKVNKGYKIGIVGGWPHDSGRSHTHLGCTHPMGDIPSKRAIRNVAEAHKKVLV
jgi:murein DD-endopeptidase MepM/ murein hydrolase activator NlpD